MGRILQQYVDIKRDTVVASLIDSDLNELKLAAGKFLHDATIVGGKAIGASFFKWLSSFAAIGEVGEWIAFVTVVLRLFFPRHFPGMLNCL
ncbi:hypothetical protein ACSQ67_007658 [Phaseolus vulgaris]